MRKVYWNSFGRMEPPLGKQSGGEIGRYEDLQGIQISGWQWIQNIPSGCIVGFVATTLFIRPLKEPLTTIHEFEIDGSQYINENWVHNFEPKNQTDNKLITGPFKEEIDIEAQSILGDLWHDRCDEYQRGQLFGAQQALGWVLGYGAAPHKTIKSGTLTDRVKYFTQAHITEQFLKEQGIDLDGYEKWKENQNKEGSITV